MYLRSRNFFPFFATCVQQFPNFFKGFDVQTPRKICRTFLLYVIYIRSICIPVFSLGIPVFALGMNKTFQEVLHQSPFSLQTFWKHAYCIYTYIFLHLIFVFSFTIYVCIIYYTMSPVDKYNANFASLPNVDE